MDNTNNKATVADKTFANFDVREILTNTNSLAPLRSDAGAGAAGLNLAALQYGHLDFGDQATLYGAANVKPADIVVVKAKPAPDTTADVGSANRAKEESGRDLVRGTINRSKDQTGEDLVGNYNHSQINGDNSDGDFGNDNHASKNGVNSTGDVGNHNHASTNGDDSTGDVGNYNHASTNGDDSTGDVGNDNHASKNGEK